MFDPNTLVIGGVPAIFLVLGLVEFFKSLFSIEGKPATALSMGIGVVIAIWFQLVTEIPTTFAGWSVVVIVGLVFGLSASGFYKLLNTRFPKVDA